MSADSLHESMLSIVIQCAGVVAVGVRERPGAANEGSGEDMKRLVGLVVAFTVLAPSAAFAQTCASPLPLESPNSSVTGTTCGGEAGIPLGGTVAPHPARVYSFSYLPPGSPGAAVGPF